MEVFLSHQKNDQLVEFLMWRMFSSITPFYERQTQNTQEERSDEANIITGALLKVKQIQGSGDSGW